MHCLWNKSSHILGCQDEGLTIKMKAMKHLGEKRKDRSYKGRQKGNQLPQLWPYVTKVMFHEIDPSLNICQHLGFQSLSWLFACWSGYGWKSMSRRYRLLRKENMHLCCFILILSRVRCTDISLEMSSEDPFYMNLEKSSCSGFVAGIICHALYIIAYTHRDSQSNFLPQCSKKKKGK